MSEKIQFRHRAREHFKAAQALMKTEKAELLLPAALRLRMAIECLAYELLQSLQNDADDGTMETWQPGKLIKELKEIDAGIESDHTISIGIEDVPGEPAKTMHSLGTDARLKASWISKHWNALGSYLHEPTIKQHKEGKVFDPESAREKIVAISAEIERVLSSSIFASNIAAFITFTCECGHSIKRRESLIEKESSITCAKCQSIWNAERIDGQWRLAYLYHNFVCPNCDEKNQVPAKEPQDGLEFDCRACGAVSSIQRGWTLRLQSVPNRQNDK